MRTRGEASYDVRRRQARRRRFPLGPPHGHAATRRESRRGSCSTRRTRHRHHNARSCAGGEWHERCHVARDNGRVGAGLVDRWPRRSSTCRSIARHFLRCRAGGLGGSGAVLTHGDWFPLTNPVVRSRLTASAACRQAHGLRELVRRVGIEPTTRWLGVACSAVRLYPPLCWSVAIRQVPDHGQ